MGYTSGPKPKAPRCYYPTVLHFAATVLEKLEQYCHYLGGKVSERDEGAVDVDHDIRSVEDCIPAGFQQEVELLVGVRPCTTRVS